MKRIYITPSLYVHNIKTNNILAGSPTAPISEKNADETQNPNGENSGQEAKSAWGLDW